MADDNGALPEGWVSITGADGHRVDMSEEVYDYLRQMPPRTQAADTVDAWWLDKKLVAFDGSADPDDVIAELNALANAAPPPEIP